MLKRVLKFLGSTNLALLLLAVLIIACVLATVVEKRLTFQVVRIYVYGSWWFTLWLALLGLNVFCAAAARFPWRRRQIGFVITHAGIVLILLGARIDQQWGIEGNVRLIQGDAPVDRMIMVGEDLVVEASGQDEPARTPFTMALLKRDPEASFHVASPSPDVRIEAIGVKPVTPGIGDVVAAEDGKPALKWRFISAMMGERESWLFLGEQVGFGPAVIRFTRGEPPVTQGRAELSFYFDGTGQLQYRRSSKAGSSSGAVEIGKKTPLKWGMEASFVVERFLPKSRPQVVWTPTDKGHNEYGLRCRVEAGGQSELVWVGPRLAPPLPAGQEVSIGGKTVLLFFDNRTAKLPFSMQLMKFDAPYHEGLADRNRFTKFVSHLRFNGKEGSEQTASMNNPATYPPTWWGPILGSSYRISQASHEMPNRPDVSIVQVLRDPGWFPKWLGSVLICVGIFTMFYLSGSRKTANRSGQDSQQEDGESGPPAEK